MIPTIEKRFQMTSKDLGIIAASQDIPGLIIIGFVSYFGEHGNKIKWLGYGGIITGQLYVFLKKIKIVRNSPFDLGSGRMISPCKFFS